MTVCGQCSRGIARLPTQHSPEGAAVGMRMRKPNLKHQIGKMTNGNGRKMKMEVS